jgi:hypothetical protein
MPTSRRPRAVTQTRGVSVGCRVGSLLPAVAVFSLAMLLASCGGDARQPSADSEVLLVTSGPGTGSGSDAEIAGVVTLDEGCVRVGEYPAVWPEGTTWDSARQALMLPSGLSVAIGESVSGAGGYPYVEDIEDEFPGKEVEALAECAGPTHEVAYFNRDSDVARVTTSLSAE